VDLIFGWPGQSIDAMQLDLETLVSYRVRHITHYELNLAGRTDFARRRAELPSLKENLKMYRASKNLGHGVARSTLAKVLSAPPGCACNPTRILRGHAQNERRDRRHDPWAARPLRRERPLPGDQLPVPPEVGVGIPSREGHAQHLQRGEVGPHWPILPGLGNE